MDTMKLTDLSKAKQTVVLDAEKAGFTVAYKTGCVKVYRESKHKTPRLLNGICIYADGMGYRMDVPLDRATTIRSAPAMRAMLGI